jgi:catechol-2,3-dioxygenase
MSATAIRPVDRVMLTRGFAELTIEVRDLEALERFYREVFCLSVLAREDDRVWLAAGERARLGLWLPGEKEFGDEGGRHVHFAFSAGPGGFDALVDRLDAAGHDYRGPVEHDGGDRSLYVEDLEGNVVEVWDFFERGEGRREGAAALAGGDVQRDDPSS